MNVFEEAQRARRRIAPHIRCTPVEASPFLSAAGSCRAHLKLECHQLSGSFKLRGAMNKLLALSEAGPIAGVVAASSGNHGMAVARGAESLGCPAVVFVPQAAAPSKIEAIRALGAEIRVHGPDCVLAEAAARAFARDNDLAYISPYNDADVVAGQGTMGLEILEQVPAVDTVLVSLGGGGMLAGVGSVLKAARPQSRLVACSPENSQVMHASLAAGRILDLPSKPTLSDGTAGGVEADAMTFPLCRKLVDASVLVTESEIASALREIVERHHTLIEGSAAVAVAAFLKQADAYAGRNVVIVLCGANIGVKTLGDVL